MSVDPSDWFITSVGRTAPQVPILRAHIDEFRGRARRTNKGEKTERAPIVLVPQHILMDVSGELVCADPAPAKRAEAATGGRDRLASQRT